MKQLITLLEENARLTCEQLGAMLGCPAQEVKEEIAAMEKAGIIKGYKTVIDWERMEEKPVTAIIELKVSPKKELGFDEIAETIMCFSEVESVTLMSGGYDLSVLVTGKSFQEVALFVANRLSTLDSVLSTATHFVLKRYKDRGICFEKKNVDERSQLL